MSGETAAPQVKRYVIQVNLDGRGARARWIKQIYSQIDKDYPAGLQEGKKIASEIIFENKHSKNIGYVKPIPQQITAIVEAIKNQSTADNSVEDSIKIAFKNILIPLNLNAFSEIDKWASSSTGTETQLFADSTIAGYMVRLFEEITRARYGVSLTPLDLFHGHLILYGYGEEAGFGILFHAKEYPTHIGEKTKEQANELMIDKNVVKSLNTLPEWENTEYSYRNFLWTASNGAINVIIETSTQKIHPSLDPRTKGNMAPFYDFEKTQAVEQQLFGYEFGAINYFPGTRYEKPFVKGSKVTP